MTSLNPHQDAAVQVLAQLDAHLVAVSGESPKHARHARCIRAVLTATVQAIAAERDAGVDDYEILEALQNALANAMTSICSTIAGDTRSPLAALIAWKLLAGMTARAREVLGPEAAPTSEFVGSSAMVGRA